MASGLFSRLEVFLEIQGDTGPDRSEIKFTPCHRQISYNYTTTMKIRSRASGQGGELPALYLSRTYDEAYQLLIEAKGFAHH